MNALVVTPAYGRDYPSAAKAIEAWNEGKDFKAANLTRTYVSKQDLVNFPHGFTQVNIRYQKLQKVAVVQL